MIVSCVENAIAVLNGEEVEHTIVLPSEIVDRDNVADHLDANSPDRFAGCAEGPKAPPLGRVLQGFFPWNFAALRRFFG